MASALIAVVILVATLKSSTPKVQIQNIQPEVHDPLRDKILDMHERVGELQHRKFAILPQVERTHLPASASVISADRRNLINQLKSKEKNGS